MNTKTILVTGGTSGIGFATAKHLLEQGHKVIITGRRADKLELATKELGHDVKSILSDSSDLTQIELLAQSLQEQNILLDGLVLNAGIMLPAPFAYTTPELFDQTFNTNFKGPFFTIQYFLPVLRNTCSIVLISSLAVESAFKFGSAYSASKAALEGISRTLNVELAPMGIRLNSVRPGMTATELQAKAGLDDKTTEHLFKSLESTPLGRVLDPKDITGAISFLLSDASVGLRNAHITIDGGSSL